MTKKEILLKQRNSENAPLTNYIGTDGYVWKMIENAMEEYHQAKLKLLGIGGVSQQRELLIDFMNKTQGKLIWSWDIGGGEKLADEYLKGNL
jgi:hypothetical protein